MPMVAAVKSIASSFLIVVTLVFEHLHRFEHCGVDGVDIRVVGLDEIDEPVDLVINTALIDTIQLKKDICNEKIREIISIESLLDDIEKE